MGKFIRHIRKIRKLREIFLRLGKFIRKIGKEILRLGKLSDNIRKVEGEKKGPHLILVGKLGKFSHIRKVHLAD